MMDTSEAYYEIQNNSSPSSLRNARVSFSDLVVLSTSITYVDYHLNLQCMRSCILIQHRVSPRGHEVEVDLNEIT